MALWKPPSQTKEYQQALDEFKAALGNIPEVVQRPTISEEDIRKAAELLDRPVLEEKSRPVVFGFDASSAWEDAAKQAAEAADKRLYAEMATKHPQMTIKDNVIRDNHGNVYYQRDDKFVRAQPMGMIGDVASLVSGPPPNAVRGSGWGALTNNNGYTSTTYSDGYYASNATGRTPLSLEGYVKTIQNMIPVKDVTVLFDDRPEEVVLRVTFVSGQWLAISNIMQNINNLAKNYQIEDCKKLSVTYSTQEVYAWED